MTTATELEGLHNRYNKLKEKQNKAKGSIDTITSQLKKLGVNSQKETTKFIQVKNKQVKKDEKELQEILTKVDKLL